MLLVNCNLKKFIVSSKSTQDHKTLELFQLYENNRDEEEGSTDRDEKSFLLDERIKLISSIENNNPFVNDGLLCIFMDTYKVKMLEIVSKKLNFSNLQTFISTYNTIKTAQEEKGRVSKKIRETIEKAQYEIISAVAKTDFADKALAWIIINDSSKELVLYANQQAADNNIKLKLPWCFNSMMLAAEEKQEGF